jgi:tetratricopeptide (TPR) repeat protein
MRPSRTSIAAFAVVAALAAALLVVYLPGLGNGLVYDDSYLTQGLFSEYASLFPLRVRSFSYGSFVWLQAIFGDGWWKQRLLNLVLHGAVVASLWAFYRELLRHVAFSGDEPDALPYTGSPALGIAIAFFALNPVAVYAVGYLIQRSILLATLFTVLALWLFARGLRVRRPQPFVLAVACYALAVASKEHAVLAPLAALPVFILVARPSPRRLAILAACGALLIALAGALLYTRYGEILGKPFDEYSHLYLDQLAKLAPEAPRQAWLLSIVNEAWLFFRYGVLWFLPYAGWMSIDLRPPFPLHWYAFPQALGIPAYLALVVGGFFLLLRYRDARALAGACLLIPALLFGTEFATVWVQDPFVLYRSYLWAIGVPGLVFFALHGTPARVLLGVGAVLGSLLAWQALDRVLSMESPESVWSDAIAKLPDDPRSVGRWFPYLNRGSDYAERNQFALALRDFEASAALGDEGMGTFNIGSILSAQRKPREALAAFDRARKEGYDLYNLHFQRGLVELALGDAAEAEREMRATLERSPDPTTRNLALLQLGRLSLQLGRKDEAVRALEKLLALEPKQRDARFLLGMAYVMRNEPQSALTVLDALIADAPEGRAYYARALANYALRRKAAALADLDSAARKGVDPRNLREWRAKILALP